MENVWIAIIVACTTLVTSTIAPVVMAYVTWRTARSDRRADWLRQDEVARRVKQVALDQAQQAVDTVAGLKSNSQKLDVVHSLVNSQLQAALQAEHDALVAQLVLIRELVAVRTGEGTGPFPETLATIERISTRVNELAHIIEERNSRAPPR
jgi:uncharacterized Fe-S cluster-containing radical SAM superfamily protein